LFVDNIVVGTCYFLILFSPKANVFKIIMKIISLLREDDFNILLLEYVSWGVT